MGLVICYVLTGCHPFDENEEEPDAIFRQPNIKRGNASNLEKSLKKIGELTYLVFDVSVYCYVIVLEINQMVAKDLVERMIQKSPEKRYRVIILSIKPGD